MQPSRFVMVESAAAACESPRAAAACVCDKLMAPRVAAKAETGSNAAITTHKTKRMMYLRVHRAAPRLKRIPVSRVTYFGLILNWTKRFQRCLFVLWGLVGIAIGQLRAGYAGALAAWVGFWAYYPDESSLPNSPG